MYENKFVDKTNMEDSIISRVVEFSRAIFQHQESGPNFEDLRMYNHFNYINSCYYRPSYYQSNFLITTTDGEHFSVDEYEVFRVLKK
ncbi:hypothetical protein Glove_209g48 [Diversispora epigaea]|uniref:Uncharacterized protein n=1 Tax=Diversispora epigaea TaxID=1348612 RepID=A0A397IIL3_9GLOM|nr:hypothetical protein Glove_209g48 [Diversispora epigaea]